MQKQKLARCEMCSDYCNPRDIVCVSLGNHTDPAKNKRRHVCQHCYNYLSTRELCNIIESVDPPVSYCILDDGSIMTITPVEKHLKGADSHYENNNDDMSFFYDLTAAEGSLKRVTLSMREDTNMPYKRSFIFGERAFLTLEEAKEKSQDILANKLDELAREFSKVKKLFEARTNGDYESRRV